jgi:hypothetical protein
MHIISLLVVILSFSVVRAQETKKDDPPQEQPKIPPALAESNAILERWRANVPATLAEAHTALERMLSPQTLAEIDAMPSENEMIKYHFSLGLNIRNGWGLWAGSPLAKYMQGLGFTHPDNMSGVILETFWRKRHGQDLRLEELAAGAKKAAEAERKAREEQEKRDKKRIETMRNMLLGLRFEKRDVPVVQIPSRGTGMNVRFLSRFRSGVFGTFYCQGSTSSHSYIPAGRGGYYIDPADGQLRETPEADDSVMRGFCMDRGNREPRKMKPGEDVYTQGFYFDPADRKTHLVRVADINNVYSAVAVGGRAWFAGLTNGTAVLVGIGEQDRIKLSLPQEDEIPDLGWDGQSLLAVYSKTIYRLTDGKWTLVHSGDILLPRSCLPPQLHGDRVFLRDEGRLERQKRLWWLTLGERLHLSVLDRDIGLADPPTVIRDSRSPSLFFVTPRVLSGWDEVSTYCVTKSGDLWACVGGRSLLRRSEDGHYAIAIMNGSVQFREDPFAREKTDQDVSISAVTALPDDTLLLAGRTGLYRLKGNELVQELAFTVQEQGVGLPIQVRGSRLSPSNLLVLDEQSYFLGSDHWEGVCLLRKGNDGQWSFIPLDDGERGDPVVW